MHVMLTIKKNKQNILINSIVDSNDIYGRKLVIDRVELNQTENIYGLKFSGIPNDSFRNILKSNSWIFNSKLKIWEPASDKAKRESNDFSKNIILKYN